MTVLEWLLIALAVFVFVMVAVVYIQRWVSYREQQTQERIRRGPPVPRKPRHNDRLHRLPEDFEDRVKRRD